MIYTCSYCLIKGDKFFSCNTPDKMKRHRETKKHQENIKLCLKNDFTCGNCDSRFPSQKALDKHYENNTYIKEEIDGSKTIKYNPTCNDFECYRKYKIKEYGGLDNNGYSRYTQQKGCSYSMKPLTKCCQTFSSYQEVIEHEKECDGLSPYNTSVGGQPKKGNLSRKRNEIKKPKGFDERFELNKVKIVEENIKFNVEENNNNERFDDNLDLNKINILNNNIKEV